MGRCVVCENDYDKSFEVNYRNKSYIFDCFECAIHALAPACEHCGCKIIGHGVEVDNKFYCCANCGNKEGKSGFRDRL